LPRWRLPQGSPGAAAIALRAATLALYAVTLVSPMTDRLAISL
jgi:hypothetical protein